jgi:hypothetical protein
MMGPLPLETGNKLVTVLVLQAGAWGLCRVFCLLKKTENSMCHALCASAREHGQTLQRAYAQCILSFLFY